MSQENITKNYSNQLERASWFLTLFGMMTQLSSEVAFPSYNVALGFWGAYCSYSRNGRATFGFITFAFLGVVMDIVFCSINGSAESIYVFSLTMLIFCLFIKLYTLYYASLFFSSIGGARSLESSNLTASGYDPLTGSNSSEAGQGVYYPPDSSAMMESANSFNSSGGGNNNNNNNI